MEMDNKFLIYFYKNIIRYLLISRFFFKTAKIMPKLNNVHVNTSADENNIDIQLAFIL